MVSKEGKDMYVHGSDLHTHGYEPHLHYWKLRWVLGHKQIGFIMTYSPKFNRCSLTVAAM